MADKDNQKDLAARVREVRAELGPGASTEQIAGRMQDMAAHNESLPTTSSFGKQAITASSYTRCHGRKLPRRW